MANYYIAPESSFDATADAIRAKTGSQATIEWTEDGFADAIEEIGEAVWTRPSDWPNLDALDISGGNVIYMTYSADEVNGFCDFTCKTSSGQYKVEMGTISGSTFTPDITYNINSNTACRHYFGSALGGYKVFRVTGNLTSFATYSTGVNSYDGQYRYGNNQGMLELRGKAQGLTGLEVRAKPFLQHIYLYGSSATSSTFRDNPRLILAELPYVVTSSTTSMQNMFMSDSLLRKIDTTGWNLANVESLSNCFYGNSSLQELDVSGWNTANVTDFGSTFNGCYALREIDVGDWDTGSGTIFSSMFYNTRSRERLDISKWDMSSAVNISSIFHYSPTFQLAGVGVKNWDVGSVANFSSVFNGAPIDQIDISGWDMSSGTNTTSIFQGCSNITGSLIIPASITTIGANAFNNTRQILEFHFKSTTPPALDNTNAFSNMGDGGGKKIYVPYSADHSILTAYQTATNWSTYASYIYEEAAP